MQYFCRIYVNGFYYLKEDILRRIIVVVMCTLVLFSCEIINPEEKIPSYIYIDEFKLNTLSGQGGNTHKITDAWVYIDGNFHGVYELPATFPVLASGVHDIRLAAGIKMNGISSSREIYPFYTRYDIQRTLTEAKIDTFLPEVSYLSELSFSNLWLEEFEDAGMLMDTTSNSMVDIVQVFDTTQGSKVGYVELSSTLYRFECYSEQIVLPTNGSRVYIEMEYKCNQEFYTGLYANILNSSMELVPVMAINSSSGQWNKIYIDLSQILVNYTNAKNFILYFSSEKSDDVTTGSISFDNIKIIHL